MKLIKTHFVILLSLMLTITIFISCSDGGSSASDIIPGSDKDITAFSFEWDNNDELDSTATGYITGTDIAVTVPSGTGLESLIATFTVTGTSITVSDTGFEQISGSTKNDFTGPVTYIVTAEDKTTQSYTVNVAIGAAVTTTPIAGNLLFTPEIKGTSATGGGNVTSQGDSPVTSRGLCWNIAGTPLITTDSYVTDGSGTGEFTTASMTNLAENTAYYVRAYATNDQGTVYGNEIILNSGWAFDGTERYGGYVFYNNGSGGGLVTAKEDQNVSGNYTLAWGPAGIDENGDDSATAPELTGIGDGNVNTEYIYDAYGPSGTVEADTLTNYPAFKACLDNDDGTYKDWFLPSKDELDAIYKNLHAHGLGGFADHYYRSSSESASDVSWSQMFDTGSPYLGDQGNWHKGNSYRVRAVRVF